jgi:hypothetical protein
MHFNQYMNNTFAIHFNLLLPSASAHFHTGPIIKEKAQVRLNPPAVSPRNLFSTDRLSSKFVLFHPQPLLISRTSWALRTRMFTRDGVRCSTPGMKTLDSFLHKDAQEKLFVQGLRSSNNGNNDALLNNLGRIPCLVPVLGRRQLLRIRALAQDSPLLAQVVEE